MCTCSGGQLNKIPTVTSIVVSLSTVGSDRAMWAGFPTTVALDASHSGCHWVATPISPGPSAFLSVPLAQLQDLSPLSKWGSFLEMQGEKTLFLEYMACQSQGTSSLTPRQPLTPRLLLNTQVLLLSSLCYNNQSLSSGCLMSIVVSPDTPGNPDIHKWFWGSSPKCTYVCAHGTHIAQLVKNPLIMQETSVWFPGQEDPLEKG